MSRYAAKGSPHTKNDETISAPQARAVPKSAVIKTGVTAATFMACMAAMPCWAGRRARALITKAEKAKKTPAITPHPRAATNVSANRRPFIGRHVLADPSPHAGRVGFRARSRPPYLAPFSLL